MALSLFLPLAHAGPSGHNVLIVGSQGSQQPAYEQFMRGFRASLRAEDGNFELFTEFLDSARFPQADHKQQMARALQDKYSSTRIDLIITVSPPALPFMLDHRTELFPGVPLIYALVSARELPAGTLPPDVIGVRDEFDPVRTVELARRLQPQARHAVIVSGVDAFDKMWEGIVRNELQAKLDGLDVRYLSGLPERQLLEEVARLPPQTFVLVLTVFRDGAGQIFRPVDVAHSVSMASTAPTYSFFSNFMDHGVVGGYINSYEAVGERTAALASRLLSGARLGQLRPDPPKGEYLVDWRQMQRWGLSEARLPPGSVLRFREPSPWMAYRWQIVAAAILLFAQAILIATLLIQRRRRKIVELEVQRQRVELGHVSRLTILGELSASIAHEVNQPLAAIAGNADAVELLLDADPAQLDDARRVLVDLKAANQRASDVVRRVRDMVRKREAVSETYDLNGAISDVMRLLEAEARRRQIDVGTELEVSPPVRGDRLHFQQVMVNLVMNGMDAVADMPEGERRITVRTGRNSDNCAEVAVADTGRGIPTADITRVFDSFFTTKKEGMGLGLSLCRSLVQAHGGRIWAQNNAGPGATFRFTVPYESLPA